MAAAVARSLGNDAYNLLNYCAFGNLIMQECIYTALYFSGKVLSFCSKLSNGCKCRVSMLRFFHLLCVRLTLGIHICVCICVCMCVCY